MSLHIRLYQTLLNIGQAFQNPLPSVHPIDMLIGVLGMVVIYLTVYIKGKNAKKFRPGVEYGSARWGNAKDINKKQLTAAQVQQKDLAQYLIIRDD